VLQRLGVKGLAADVAMARSWYETARELGSTEAHGRLEMLARRN
jgi:TPR repeat protein